MVREHVCRLLDSLTIEDSVCDKDFIPGIFSGFNPRRNTP